MRHRLADGLSWNFVNQLSTQAASLVSMVVLARLLTKEDYGIVGMVLAITGFAAIFVDLGLSPAVIRKQEVTQVELSTAFWTNNAMGWVVLAVLWLLADFLARFYREPALVAVTQVSAFSFVLMPLASLHRVHLLKALQVRTLALVNLISLTVSTGSAILLASFGWGYWSLVGQALILSAMNTLLLWSMVDWRPSWTFSIGALRGFLGFSGYFSGTQIIGYWTRNLDKVLIGRMAGSADLGIYSRVYMLMLLPLQQVAQVVDIVLFPAYATIQNDPHQIAQIYLKISRLVALVTFPLSFGLWAVAQPAVLVLFGEPWKEMVPLLRILAPLGALQSVLALNSSLYLARGQTRRAFLVTVGTSLVLVPTFYFGLRCNGTTGLAWAYLGVAMLMSPGIYLAASTLVGLGLRPMIRNLSGVAISTMIMATTVSAASVACVAWPSLLQLALLVPLGIAVYIASLVLLRVPAYHEARLLLLSKLGRR
ncbi:MAG: MOP flippase family protein [Limisphaerales bacterium]